MMIEKVHYDFVAQTIEVEWANGTRTKYTAADAAKYLADTGRSDDLEAIGWSA